MNADGAHGHLEPDDYSESGDSDSVLSYDHSNRQSTARRSDDRRGRTRAPRSPLAARSNPLKSLIARLPPSGKLHLGGANHARERTADSSSSLASDGAGGAEGGRVLLPHPSRLHPNQRPDFPEAPTLRAQPPADEASLNEFAPLLNTSASHAQSGRMKIGRYIKPVVEEGSLSIVERVFFKSSPGRPQVIMGIILRLRLPPTVERLQLERVVDLLRLAQSRHYRLSSYVDPETMLCHLLAANAADLPCNYRFVGRTEKETWKQVYEEEINTNFDVDDTSRPLWRSVVILPEEMMPAESDPVSQGQSPINSHCASTATDSTSILSPLVLVTPADNDAPDVKGKAPEDSSSSKSSSLSSSSASAAAEPVVVSDPDLKPGESYFEIMFSFHHCLGDGLSMFAYARTFLENADARHLNADHLDLANVPVVNEPPPLIDNLLDPWIFEVIPVIAGMAIGRLAKKGRRFKGHRTTTSDDNRSTSRPTAVIKRDLSSASLASARGNGSPRLDLDDVVPPRSPSPALSSHSYVNNGTPSPVLASGDVVVGLGVDQGTPSASSTAVATHNHRVPKPLSGHTRVRFLWFDAEFIGALRRKSKAEGTTIAAVMVVAALAAVRTSFATLPKYAKKPLPSHQGWVVTNSVRHMLPQSNLLKGGDREIDEGLKMFGGYAGSVTNSSLLLVDSSEVWERCRVVRKSISRCFRDSIQRMKLMNYCYRHPALWKMVERRVDLAKLSRSYSVEVANLGAWEDPAAGPDAGPEDERLRLDHFGGVVNSSFDGVRGLFTLGLVTLGGRMSCAVGYDVSAVHEEDADSFVHALCYGMTKMRDAEGKLTVLDIRK
ncbi:hypothetical protein HK101_008595 [Irineochytrium annulatum]|nr:hypothetical protein HK101_008595 [Irineochytrium annulatum]